MSLNMLAWAVLAALVPLAAGQATPLTIINKCPDEIAPRISNSTITVPNLQPNQTASVTLPTDYFGYVSALGDGCVEGGFGCGKSYFDFLVSVLLDQ